MVLVLPWEHYNADTNQLNRLTDSVDTNNYTVDIDDQVQVNHLYDFIGNLVYDDQEGFTNIDWNVYGKIRQIDRYSNPGEAASINYFSRSLANDWI
jgi:hypothetical protein